jgi:hypothetical protein
MLVLDEAIATPKSSHFIQNSSKLDYFYSLNPASSLWLIEYSKRLGDALSLFWFWRMKQSQHQGGAILFKILVDWTISTAL